MGLSVSDAMIELRIAHLLEGTISRERQAIDLLWLESLPAFVDLPRYHQQVPEARPRALLI